jgi:hypothetical protein
MISIDALAAACVAFLILMIGTCAGVEIGKRLRP